MGESHRDEDSQTDADSQTDDVSSRMVVRVGVSGGDAVGDGIMSWM